MPLDEFISDILALKPSTFIRKDEEKIFELIPELGKCKELEQCSQSNPYDIYESTLRVLDTVGCNIPLRMAALFHDTGKVSCPDDEKYSIKSAENFRDFAKKTNFGDIYSSEIINMISTIILYQDEDLFVSGDKLTEIIEELGFDVVIVLIYFKKAVASVRYPEDQTLIDGLDAIAKNVNMMSLIADRSKYIKRIN